MTTWNKQTSTSLAQKSVAVLSFEVQIPRAFSFTQKILSAELVLEGSSLTLCGLLSNGKNETFAVGLSLFEQ